ncbi:MAG: MFS transporter [Planctomycetota bacterium]|nr:MFS transporter [Planctomycetota bacterium]
MYERYTAHFHLRAVAGQGMVAGVLLFNEYVARKHFGASQWDILALLLIPAITQLTAVFWNPASSRTFVGRYPFRTLGIGVHTLLFVPLLLGAWFGAGTFVALAVVVGVAHILLVPVQNTIVARNYSEARRGRSFGRSAAVNGLAILVISVPLGLWLDHDPSAWIFGYAVAGAAAVYAYHQWGLLRRRRPLAAPADLETHGSAWRTLLRDKRFLAFEGCFMVYGLGFLALQPVLPIYLVDEVGVDYAEIGLARGAIFWLAVMVTSPFAGRLGDRIGILRLAALGFLVLGLFPLLLWLLPNRVGLFAGFAIYGAAMACVGITWNLGPITLARGRDPVPYLNAHIGAVALRAIVGMTAGTAVYGLAGSAPVFLGVVALEIIAAVLMLRLARTMERPAA